MTHLEWLKTKRVKTEVIKRTKYHYKNYTEKQCLDIINKKDLSHCFDFFTEGPDKGEAWWILNDEWIKYRDAKH